MNRKKNMTEGECIMKLIDEGEPFEDQCVCQLLIGITKTRIDKGQIVLNKNIKKMTGLDETITSNELAKILGKVKTSILRRAKKEGWVYEIGKNRIQRFIMAGLPEDVRIAVIFKRWSFILRPEIQKLDEQIEKAQEQKKRYEIFLREMENKGK